MTRSPFPGMDPWMELRWRDVHASMIIYIRNQLQRQLPDPLIARAEETVSIDDLGPDRPPSARPDITVVEDQQDELHESAVATLSPVAEVAHVQIIDPSSGDRVITAIEVLSPTNKLPGEGRKAYRSKQHHFVSAGVNLVEIDFVRVGDWIFSVTENALPPEKRTPYMICVFRAVHPYERAFYPLPLRERLPRFAIPLRSQDKDIVLDLQPVIDEAYETGRYDRTDYRRPLKPPPPPEDVAWASEILRKAGRL